MRAFLAGALLLAAGCGGDAPWVCPVGESCDEKVPPFHIVEDPGPSSPSPATSPGPAALDVPCLVDVDAGVSVLSPVEVSRG